MEMFISKGQLLFGIAVTAFGAGNLACASFGLTVRGVPWFPGNPFLGFVTGIVLFAAGLSIAANVRARLTAILLGFLFLLYLLLIEVPLVVATPMSVSVRTVFFETLALGSSALTLAGTLPRRESNSGRWHHLLDTLIGLAPFLFAASSVVFGIDHFLVLRVIAGLVPTWIPGGLFWAYFTGTAFIVAGVSIASRWMDQLGAFLLGTMFLLWFVLVHTPRILGATPNIQNAWSSAFIALGMWGGSWLVALHAQQRRRRMTLPGR